MFNINVIPFYRWENRGSRKDGWMTPKPAYSTCTPEKPPTCGKSIQKWCVAKQVNLQSHSNGAFAKNIQNLADWEATSLPKNRQTWETPEIERHQKFTAEPKSPSSDCWSHGAGLLALYGPIFKPIQTSSLHNCFHGMYVFNLSAWFFLFIKVRSCLSSSKLRTKILLWICLLCWTWKSNGIIVRLRALIQIALTTCQALLWAYIIAQEILVSQYEILSLSSSFYRWGKRGTERLSNWLKVTQLLRGGGRNWTLELCTLKGGERAPWKLLEWGLWAC